MLYCDVTDFDNEDSNNKIIYLPPISKQVNALGFTKRMVNAVEDPNNTLQSLLACLQSPSRKPKADA